MCRIALVFILAFTVATFAQPQAPDLYEATITYATNGTSAVPIELRIGSGQQLAIIRPGPNAVSVYVSGNGDTVRRFDNRTGQCNLTCVSGECCGAYESAALPDLSVLFDNPLMRDSCTCENTNLDVFQALTNSAKLLGPCHPPLKGNLWYVRHNGLFVEYCFGGQSRDVPQGVVIRSSQEVITIAIKSIKVPGDMFGPPHGSCVCPSSA